MANPIIGRPDAFTRNHAPTQQYPQQGYQQYPPPGYGQQQGYQQAPQGYPQNYDYQQQPAPAGGVMTLDDVLAKTGITLGVVFLVAAATFMLLPNNFALLSGAALISALVGFVTVMFVARRQTLPVGGVMIYAAVEGIFVGAFSKLFEILYPGIVVSAVLATFVTAAATLAAYKFLNIRVTAKFRKIVTIATMSLAGVLLVNLGLVLFGVETGLRGTGSGAGLLVIGVSIVAVVLAVLNLITDFDSVERGIAAQAPANESWRAALGIAVTMVWLYTELLRILSYFRD